LPDRPGEGWTCENGGWTEPPPPPDEEICDGVDNDQDGATDEGPLLDRPGEGYICAGPEGWVLPVQP
jgi:hypothetical protein